MLRIDGQFSTDTATLALFDPERLSHRAAADADWWCFEGSELLELKTGVLALVGLEGDGHYRVRVTDEDLTPDERDYAAAAVRGLGVEVRSGRLFVGPAECLPGGGSRFAPEDARRGLLVNLCEGPYEADVYAISWSESSRWWQDDSPRPDGAPADLVVVLRPRSTTFDGIHADTRLFTTPGDYLFESSTRSVGPASGMLLTTKVRRDPTGALGLKPCGPLDYDGMLSDVSAVAWKDTVRVRVIQVDHDAKRFVAEFVEKVEGGSRGGGGA